MIEATCSACGTLNRIAETDVPVGAKYVTCASCKARVSLPASAGTLDLSDLPAPKPRPNPLAGAAPTASPSAKAALNLDGDLPTPKPRAPLGGGIPKPPASNALNLDDFLAPAEPDLPAPKARGGRMTDLPATKPTEDLLDLPAPKSRSTGVTELPRATSLNKSTGVTDLPTPKGPGVTDLPAPKGGGKSTIDLPMPKSAASTDLPVPKGAGSTGLPAPKGGGIDLPAPKGFFDDLPQPSRNQSGGSTDLPAPKGFFDDLPQPSRNQGSQDLPAPVGFFDDLPQSKKGGDAQAPAPKGYFENVPQRAKGASQAGTDLTPSSGRDDAMELDLKGPDLDLAPSTPLAGNYNDIDISKPSTPPTRYDQSNPRIAQTSVPAAGAGLGARDLSATNLRSVGAGADSTLELEADPRNRTPELARKRKEDAAAKAPLSTQVQKGLNKKLLAGIVAGVAVLGAGGFYFYRQHAAAAERQDVIDEQLTKARAALVAPDPGHWMRAATAARKVLEVDEANPDALGLASEASFGAALDEGQAARVPAGRKLINDALAAGVTGAPIARAQALNAITMGQLDVAIAKLTPMVASSKDGFVALYLGWAQSAKGDVAAAVAAFDQAAKINKALTVPALYGRAKVKLAGGDIAGAHADFQAVYDADNKHIGAQVGLAASEPTAQQEADLLAVLQRKDIGTADPRAVGLAWVLAGNAATRGARLDAARERYRKALELNPNDVGALTGLADVELKDGKLDAATEAIVKALNQAKDDVRAQIVATELAIKQNKLDDADERIRALGARQPPLPPLDRAHLLMAKGHLLEVQHKDADAVEAFVEAAKLAGDVDLAPTLAAVHKLVALEQKERASQLLSGLEAKAETDPSIALTLGNGYLQAGDYPNAEKWLRRASDARPTDPDAMFQLGKAMAKLGKTDDAVAQLKKASEIDPSRSEIGLELAVTYEAAGRDSDAGELYAKLLTNKDASLELRGRAGRFYARTHEMEKAAAQGQQILLADPSNPAGNYLKGEGLYAEGKYEEARRAFKIAEQQDQDAQYLDAEGRALEKVVETTGDTKWHDTALQVYGKAHTLAPKLPHPLLGTGRVYFARRDWKKANDALQEAWKLDDKDGEVAFLIGRCAQELLEKKSAMQWYAKAQVLKPNAEASYRLGLLYQEVNDAKPAVDAFYRATKGAEAENKATGKTPPWLTDAYYQLGTILYQTQDFHGAKEAYERYIGRNPPDDQARKTVLERLGTSLRGN